MIFLAKIFANVKGIKVVILLRFIVITELLNVLLLFFCLVFFRLFYSVFIYSVMKRVYELRPTFRPPDRTTRATSMTSYSCQSRGKSCVVTHMLSVTASGSPVVFSSGRN